jgi:hypothetical protein
VIDATHIALDDQTLAALSSAMQRQSITLTPIEWTYRSEPQQHDAEPEPAGD